jgi:hypothetical protein
MSTLLITPADAALGAIATAEVAQEAAALNNLREKANIEGAAYCIHHDRYAQTMQVVLDFLIENSNEGRPIVGASPGGCPLDAGRYKTRPSCRLCSVY